LQLLAALAEMFDHVLEPHQVVFALCHDSPLLVPVFAASLSKGRARANCGLLAGRSNFLMLLELKKMRSP
jgi:hypothetical protein